LSDIARFWSRNLKGLNFAEHAVCRELAEHHNAESNLCFPSLATICDIFECSRPYLKKILTRLEVWNLVTRVEWFDAMERNRQTSNRYQLNLKRHFPDPAPEGRKTRDKNKEQTARPYDNRDYAALTGAKMGRRILKSFATMTPAPSTLGPLMEGLREAYLDTSTKTCWVTVDADGYMREFLNLLPDLSLHAQRELKAEFRTYPVALYFRTPTSRKR
jgi:hypothetical protein